jgi:hypothetical protein
MKILTLLLFVLLAGCAGKVSSSTGRSTHVVAPTPKQAMSLAEQECSKNGRHARFGAKVEQFEYMFDCVE